jgi:hypothetical protein
MTDKQIDKNIHRVKVLADKYADRIVFSLFEENIMRSVMAMNGTQRRLCRKIEEVLVKDIQEFYETNREIHSN